MHLRRTSQGGLAELVKVEDNTRKHARGTKGKVSKRITMPGTGPREGGEDLGKGKNRPAGFIPRQENYTAQEEASRGSIGVEEIGHPLS